MHSFHNGRENETQEARFQMESMRPAGKRYEEDITNGWGHILLICGENNYWIILSERYNKESCMDSYMLVGNFHVSSSDNTVVTLKSQKICISQRTTRKHWLQELTLSIQKAEASKHWPTSIWISSRRAEIYYEQSKQIITLEMPKNLYLAHNVQNYGESKETKSYSLVPFTSWS